MCGVGQSGQIVPPPGQDLPLLVDGRLLHPVQVEGDPAVLPLVGQAFDVGFALRHAHHAPDGGAEIAVIGAVALNPLHRPGDGHAVAGEVQLLNADGGPAAEEPPVGAIAVGAHVVPDQGDLHGAAWPGRLGHRAGGGPLRRGAARRQQQTGAQQERTRVCPRFFHLLPLVVLLDQAALVGPQQGLQILHLALQLAADVGLGDLHALLQPLEHHRVGVDVAVDPQGLLLAREGLVGDDAEAGGVEDQGVPGDAGGGLVGLAEAAVDDNELAAGLEGALPLLGLDGDVAVDDVAVGPGQAEFGQHPVAHGGVVVVGVVGVFGLGPGCFVGHEPPLEGGHAVPAEDRGVAPAPQKPQVVHAELLLRRAGLGVVGLAGHRFGVVQEGAAGELAPVGLEGHEFPVLRHGQAAVEEQVAVKDLVQPALGVNKADVLLELLAALEGGGELAYDLVLLGGEVVGVFPVHGGEVAVVQGPGPAADGHALVLVVDLVQQEPVLHAEAGVAQDLLPLQLEEDDGDGLVHPGGEELILLGVVVLVVPGQLDGEAGAVGVPVDLVGEEGQGPQGDAVAGLDDLQVVVVDGVGEHRGHQGAAAGGGPHPQHVVVAPLEVHRVVGEQGVHNDVGPGAAVEDVAHHVQAVHHHVLDELAHVDDEVPRPVDVDDGGDDVLVVVPLVVKLVVGVEQLVDDVGVLAGQGLAHLGAGVLAGDQAAHVQQAVEGDAVPLLQRLVVQRPGHLLQLLLRVVDQGGQLVPVVLGHAGGEELVHLLAHHAGGAVEDVEKGLVLPVHVGEEVLGALGQVQDGLEVDDLAAGGLDGGVLAGEHLQVAQILRGNRVVWLLAFHAFLLLKKKITKLIVSLAAARYNMGRGKGGREYAAQDERGGHDDGGDGGPAPRGPGGADLHPGGGRLPLHGGGALCVPGRENLLPRPERRAEAGEHGPLPAGVLRDGRAGRPAGGGPADPVQRGFGLPQRGDHGGRGPGGGHGKRAAPGRPCGEVYAPVGPFGDARGPGAGHRRGGGHPPVHDGEKARLSYATWKMLSISSVMGVV